MRERASKLKLRLEKLERKKAEQKDIIKQFKIGYHNQYQYLSELFKQYISLTRVINRNIKIEDQDDPYFDQETHKLPLILFKFEKETDIQIDHDQNWQSLKLTANKPFDVMNENHLFTGLGLTKLQGKEHL